MYRTGTKRLLLALFLCVAWLGITAGGAAAQMATPSGWVVQFSPVTSHYRAIAAASLSTVWAVGDNGQVNVTSDGGHRWHLKGPPSPIALHGVAAASGTVGWAVGDSGRIIRTLDGGQTWSPQSSGVSANLRGVAAESPTTAYAVGDSGTILKTTTGGASWFSVYSGPGTNFRGVAVTPIGTGAVWAVGDGGTMVASTTGGASWVTVSTGTTYPLWGVTVAPGTQDAWAVGGTLTSAVILRTNGSPTSWTSQTAPATVSGALHSVAAVSSAEAWAVGAGGTVLRTNNGGATWLHLASPTARMLSAVTVPPTSFANRSAWAAGESGTLLQWKYWLPSLSIHSSEGTSWTSNGVLISGASPAPRVLPLPDRTLRMFYWNGTSAVSATSADGTTWSSAAPVANIGGDIALIYLSDGRYRALFTQPTSSGVELKSAISNDGITFTAEPGPRYTPSTLDDNFIGVPTAVLLPNGRWRLYYVGDPYCVVSTTVCNNTRSVESPDEGLTWDPATYSGSGLSAAQSVDPDVVYLHGGGYRLYYMKYHEIYFADSGTGTSFGAGTRVIALGASHGYMDPTLVRLPGTDVRLYYAHHDTRTGTVTGIGGETS